MESCLEALIEDKLCYCVQKFISLRSIFHRNDEINNIKNILFIIATFYIKYHNNIFLQQNDFFFQNTAQLTVLRSYYDFLVLINTYIIYNRKYKISFLVLRHLGPFQSKNNNWSTLLCNGFRSFHHLPGCGIRLLWRDPINLSFITMKYTQSDNRYLYYDNPFYLVRRNPGYRIICSLKNPDNLVSKPIGTIYIVRRNLPME